MERFIDLIFDIFAKLEINQYIKHCAIMIHCVTLYVTQPNIISKQQGDTLKQKSLITKHGDKIIDSIKKIKIWRNKYY